MQRIIKIYRKFESYSPNKYSKPLRLVLFIYFVYLRKKYRVTVEEFWSNKLYDLKSDHKDYYLLNTRYQRKRKIVSHKCAPWASNLWLFFHYFDFLISRIIYPGLDAMDYFHYDFYRIKREKRKTFITEGYLSVLDKKFNGCGDVTLLADKTKFNSIFYEYIGRKWINAETMMHDEFYEFVKDFSCVIAKPLDGAQGSGIFIAFVETASQRDDLYNQLRGKHYIIEELIVQHKTMASLNKSSVNTVRVYSVKTVDSVVITAAVQRMGSGLAPTDNYSAGGMAATIDIQKGTIISPAIDKDGIRYEVHPTSGIKIIGFSIPNWTDILETVKR